MGDIGSGIGGKYSHRVWQQFWIQKPTSEKIEIFTKIFAPWARGPRDPGPRVCLCCKPAKPSQPAKSALPRPPRAVGQSLSPSKTKTGFAGNHRAGGLGGLVVWVAQCRYCGVLMRPWYGYGFAARPLCCRGFPLGKVTCSVARSRTPKAIKNIYVFAIFVNSLRCRP